MEKLSLSLLFSILLLTACRGDDIYIEPEEERKGDTIRSEIVGFYLLNEGNMGSNKASLDYYDFRSATYTRNIYQAANPSVAQSLGDVGNDIAIYGSRLYAVINCSNFIEVMDAATARHIGTIECPNCRYLTFRDGYGYLTSYAGPVLIDQGYKQLGFVAKFDTATMQIVDTCHVGFQPDDIEVVGDKIYVANSGGYMVPRYENTVSVIDLASFREIKRIEVAINLHHLRADRYGQLWVSSRGDYFDTSSNLYCINTQTDQVDTVHLPATEMWLDGDSLYVYGTQFSYETMDWTTAYAIVDVRSHAVISDHFITDGTEQNIEKPYGLMVHPVTKHIYLTDAKTYVTPGTLHCYSPDGKLLWSVLTGDIPAHLCFLSK